MARAFIIHGQDIDARDELTKFLTALGLEVRPFYRADDGGKARLILENVIAGINQADAVFVLFTPDEQAAFHDPRTGAFKERTPRGEEFAGWQPRPNVVFEAGLAVGIAGDKTALVRVGPVRRISDLDGVLYIDLDEPDAKDQLFHFVSKCLRKKPAVHEEEIARLPGDFARYLRRRWHYHDELGELEQHLRSIKVASARRKTYFDVLVDYVREQPKPSRWNSDGVTDFFYEKYEPAATSLSAYDTDGFFWNLLVHGVLAFKDIEGWDDEVLWWTNQQPFVELTTRGWAFLDKIKATTGA